MGHAIRILKGKQNLMGSNGVIVNDDFCIAKWTCHLVDKSGAANSLGALLLRPQLEII